MQTTTTSNEKPLVHYVHGAYVKSVRNNDAVIVRETLEYPNGDRLPNLAVIKNPKRKFWITKKGLRNHNVKKYICDKKDLDEYIVPQRHLTSSIFEKLNGFIPNRPPSLKSVCNSPYVYGADVPIETLVRRKYNRDVGQDNVLSKLTRGTLDLEATNLDYEHGIINLLSITIENKVYTAIHDSFLYKWENKKKVKATTDDILKLAHIEFKEDEEQYGFTYELKVCKDEVEMFDFIFKEIIQREKPEFIGIWNINFDIPFILGRMKVLGLDPIEYFTHPDVPEEFRYVNYYEDRSEKNFVLNWHHFTTTGYTQYICLQNLYAIIRYSNGLKDSYKLDDVLAEEIGRRKIELEDDHTYMQQNEFVKYTVYNMFDCMGLQELDWTTEDILNLYHQTDISPISQYVRSSGNCRDAFYDYYDDLGYAIGTVGKDMNTELTKMITYSGGTVLAPEKCHQVGAYCIAEQPSQEAMLYPHTSDIDFKAFYPRTQKGMNIAGETKKLTIVGIEGFSNRDIGNFSCGMGNMRADAVYMCSKFFNLPTYEELDDIFSSYVSKGSV